MILEFIRDNYKKNELDILEEFIQDTFPEAWNQYESDTYDGPGDNYYQQ